MELASGYKELYVNGNKNFPERERPAVELASGYKEWYIMGRKVSKPKLDNLRLKTLTLSFVLNRRIWRNTI